MTLSADSSLLRVRALQLPVALLAAVASLTACADSRSSESAVQGRSEPAATATATAPAPVAPTKLAAPTWTAYIRGEPVPAPQIEMGDPRTIKRILDEGVHRNQVMAHLTHLTQEIGPRLTGSTRLERANEWAASKFREWGLSNVHQDKWGEVTARFDRGPSSGAVYLKRARRGSEGEAGGAERDADFRKVRDLQFSTLAWTHGTEGPVRGRVVRMPESTEEFEAVKDQLNGAWVLRKAVITPGRTDMRGVGSSMSDRVLAKHGERTGTATKDLGVREADEDAFDALRAELRPYLDAGIAGFVSSSRDDRVWTTSVRRWRETKAEDAPRDIEVSITLPDYDYINSRIADGEDVHLEFDLRHEFVTGPFAVYNTVADIPGTERPDEFVIISGHLDSWDGPGSQGCTDNGTGSSVTMEAARILMAAGAKPKRTIRFILWTGEEQGLLGARSYVERYASTLDKISAMFVDDGGTNSQGGLSCTDAMVDMLAAATAPVNDKFFDSADGKPLRVNIRPSGTRMQQSGGSDHAAFVARGVPGFFWDEIGRAEYGRGWHTQFDTLELAIPEYLKQASTCSAITAYNLACAPGMLPRWQTEPAGEGEGGERRRPRRDREAEAASN
ncbi:MAG: M20/M25/M40 family metallo-hydrolase [Phycisphaeraceae bacterium]|nr:M20/M25/M40 family metallo-hydrolase [Phycisphaeraceae bacterium]